jgi:hypothetical protein
MFEMSALVLIELFEEDDELPVEFACINSLEITDPFTVNYNKQIAPIMSMYNLDCLLKRKELGLL